jgi:hypothetical protein
MGRGDVPSGMPKHVRRYVVELDCDCLVFPDPVLDRIVQAMSEIKDDGLRDQGSTAVTHLCPIHGWQGIQTYVETSSE